MRILLTLIAGLFNTTLLFAAEPPAPVGLKVGMFSLTDVTKKSEWNFAESSRDSKATVFVFLATGCPASAAYAPKLVELQKAYAENNVTVVTVFSHPTDRDRSRAR